MAISFCSASCMITPMLSAGLFPVVSLYQKLFSCTLQRRSPLGAAPNTRVDFPPALEGQLERELYQARIPRALHASEITSVGEVTVGLEELRMVERVKQFSTELKFEPFVDWRNFQKGDFPVVDSRSTA